jgi:acyl-CoA oxidase
MKRAGGGGGDEVGGSLAVWVASFRSATADLPSLLGPGASHEAAASRLRRLVRSGILKLTDVRDNPERFFAAHRVLSEFATRLGPGFGIRFTVQFNLFAGTVVALGGQGAAPASPT